MHWQVMIEAMRAGSAGARALMLVAGALLLAVHVAALGLAASAGAGWALQAGVAIGEAAGPFLAAALLLAMLAPARAVLCRADALAARVLS